MCAVIAEKNQNIRLLCKIWFLNLAANSNYFKQFSDVFGGLHTQTHTHHKPLAKMKGVRDLGAELLCRDTTSLIQKSLSGCLQIG
jgi:hypothetical protein